MFLQVYHPQELFQHFSPHLLDVQICSHQLPPLQGFMEADNWQVDFDPSNNYYLIGFRTKSVSKAARHVWIKVVRAGGSKVVDHFAENPLQYCDNFSELTPYIEGPNQTKVPVGFVSG